MNTPYNKLAKIYANCVVGMTNGDMTDMPIYGKTIEKSSSEPEGLGM